MTTEIDESTALAILEYARNLSGGVESRHASISRAAIGQSSSGVAPAMPHLALAQDGWAKALGRPSGSSAPPAQIQFPSESGHFYDPKTGNQVTLPPRTWTKTYLKHGYVPGVTTITRQLHKEALRKYDVNRAIRFAKEICGDNLEWKQWIDLMEIQIPDEQLIAEVHELMRADSDEIKGRGKELHGAIELFSQGKPFDSQWKSHVENILSTTCDHGINLDNGNAEHTFATPRYGGKIDWHNDEWLLDFKTKPEIIEGKKLAYPEHAQQLAAYGIGLLFNGQYWPDNPKHRCANVFIGVEDAQVVFHEWPEKDLLKCWRKFQALLDVWWSDYL